MSKAPIGTTAKTGEKCPESGVWKISRHPINYSPNRERQHNASAQWQSCHLEVDSVRITHCLPIEPLIWGSHTAHLYNSASISQNQN